MLISNYNVNKIVMKKILLSFALAVILSGISSCDKDFEKVNQNPILATNLDPGYLFSNAQFTTSYQHLLYPDAIVQQIINPFDGVIEGGNHNAYYDPNSSATFNNLYNNNNNGTNGPVKLLTDVINKTKTDAARSNLYNMARIWKAFVFQLLVDTYGDVPYFDAGKAFISQSYLPKYDDQKLIYDDLLKELSEAVKALDASKKTEPGDLFYGASASTQIAQWKRLGNSILLRVAMRLTKVDAVKAKQYVLIAVDPANGGTMQSNADNAFIQYNSAFTHPNSNAFTGTERANYYLAKAFVDTLKNNNDPRLAVIAVKYATPASSLPAALPADVNPANQEGLPYGYNQNTIVNAPNYPGKIGAAFKYSQLNRQTVAKNEAPDFFITYAQTQLLLAEAAQRTWIAGSAATFYNAGVRAHMDQMKTFDVSATIATSAQDAYLSAHPFDPNRALEQINTQYWIASFLNGTEAWSNFRRSGYPALAANPYPQADPAVKNSFIRRQIYPLREKSANTVNYQEAVTRQGADNMATRLFWDK